MFPGSPVPFVLGLYVVAVQHGSLVDDGLGDIFTIYWGPEEYLLSQDEFWESMNSMGIIKLGTLCLLVIEKVVLDCLHIDWLAGSTGVLNYPIV